MSSIVLFVAFVALIVLGVPIAFGMLIAAALTLVVDDTMPVAMLGQRMGTGVENFTYLAIPLFILAGAIMEHSGISRRLVNFARALVGHLPGGMGHVVVVSEIFFSGISGASLSDASAIGSLMFPALRRAGYDSARATALIAAACAMGILIPPCLTMVVLGALAGVSVSALFFAGFLPGFVMALALMALVYYQSKRGILPGGEVRVSWAATGRAGLDAILPLMMPVIIFGGILGGVFSATEAAAVAVLYATIVGMLIYREIGLRSIYRIFVETAVITGAIGLILGAAAGFATLMALNGLPAMVADLIQGVSKSPFVFMVAANLVFILFGAVLDGIPGAASVRPDLPASRAVARHRSAALCPSQCRVPRHRGHHSADRNHAAGDLLDHRNVVAGGSARLDALPGHPRGLPADHHRASLGSSRRAARHGPLTGATPQRRRRRSQSRKNEWSE